MKLMQKNIIINPMALVPETKNVIIDDHIALDPIRMFLRGPISEISLEMEVIRRLLIQQYPCNNMYEVKSEYPGKRVRLTRDNYRKPFADIYFDQFGECINPGENEVKVTTDAVGKNIDLSPDTTEFTFGGAANVTVKVTPQESNENEYTDSPVEPAEIPGVTEDNQSEFVETIPAEGVEDNQQSPVEGEIANTGAEVKINTTQINQNKQHGKRYTPRK
jgi:hypothetical protein